MNHKNLDRNVNSIYLRYYVFGISNKDVSGNQNIGGTFDQSLTNLSVVCVFDEQGVVVDYISVST